MIYGYARVSTKEQNEERQIIALKEYGVSDKNLFIDKQSGKDFEREKYKKLIRKIKKDDIIVIVAFRLRKVIKGFWKKVYSELCAITTAILTLIIDMPIINELKFSIITIYLIFMVGAIILFEI